MNGCQFEVISGVPVAMGLLFVFDVQDEAFPGINLHLPYLPHSSNWDRSCWRASRSAWFSTVLHSSAPSAKHLMLELRLSAMLFMKQRKRVLVWVLSLVVHLRGHSLYLRWHCRVLHFVFAVIGMAVSMLGFKLWLHSNEIYVKDTGGQLSWKPW